MIENGEGLHYIVVKKLHSLLRGITSEEHSNFCCLNFLHFFRTKTQLESHKKLCEKVCTISTIYYL